MGVPFPLAAVPDTTRSTRPRSIIGGGVAGIQAALEIADAGKQVYLVERTGTIGGHMAMFDKTFPTLDCAACILTPKMVAVGQHEMIDLMTYCRGRGRERLARATTRSRCARRRATWTSDACVACNACTEVCPQRAPSEFDAGIADARPSTSPSPRRCPTPTSSTRAPAPTFRRDGKKCGVCAKKCPKECIDLDREGRDRRVRGRQHRHRHRLRHLRRHARSSATATASCPTSSRRSSSSA